MPILALTLDDFRNEGAEDRLRAEMPGEALSRIDPDAFAILARNLIENALKHSPPGTPIKIVLAPSGSLSVGNEGPVIAADRLSHLKQRFERAKSGGVGSGLGLAIAESIARGANGSLDLFSPIPGKAGGFLALFDPTKTRRGTV